MEIGPLTTRAVLTVDEDDSLRDAAVGMMERGVGSAVVMADGRPSGIVTDRDTVRAVAQGVDGSATRVSDYLSRRLATATPSMEVREAARIMRDKGFRHLVVVDEGGALVGVFSMRDLVVGLLQEIAEAASKETVESG
jgi:CBS domain-containing protein